MARFLYNIAIHLYGFIIFILTPFNKKATLWIKGRRNWAKRLSKALPAGKRIIWMHVASLGEYEQGRPVLEQIRKQFPNHFILLTFFSPSGFVNMKNKEIVDLKFYLPLDTAHNANVFCELVALELVLFVKYDFWFNLLYQLNKRKINYMFISAIFREDQFFFKWYGKWASKLIFNAQVVHVQNQASAEILKTKGIHNYKLSGDTRFDRVVAIAKSRTEITGIREWIGGRLCLVAGSTWPVDDEMLIAWINAQSEQVCLIVAQHQIHSEAFLSKSKIYPNLKTVKWTDGALNAKTSAQILLIDSIGLLSSIYAYASLAYVGGGFGSGIHNVLEAAVYYIPVVIGPNYTKFSEAVRLKDEGGLNVVNNADELRSILNRLLNDENLRNEQGLICGKFVRDNQGATAKIFEDISRLLHDS
ncbi:MAG: 3-deoxy-D-manno-octulosonic acid transferase [Flavobacteriales bacterium]